MFESYTKEDLEEALEDFYESCIRGGHFDMAENARWFCRENDHMGVDYYVVLGILQKINNNQ